MDFSLQSTQTEIQGIKCLDDRWASFLRNHILWICWLPAVPPDHILLIPATIDVSEKTCSYEDVSGRSGGEIGGRQQADTEQFCHQSIDGQVCWRGDATIEARGR